MYTYRPQPAALSEMEIILTCKREGDFVVGTISLNGKKYEFSGATVPLIKIINN
jgi:hypothetical protein